MITLEPKRFKLLFKNQTLKLSLNSLRRVLKDETINGFKLEKGFNNLFNKSNITLANIFYKILQDIKNKDCKRDMFNKGIYKQRFVFILNITIICLIALIGLKIFTIKYL